MTKLNWNKAKLTSRDNGDYRECLVVPKTFKDGKYQGKNIGTIIETDPNYIAYILETHPKGKLAFQIVEYYNTYLL